MIALAVLGRLARLGQLAAVAERAEVFRAPLTHLGLFGDRYVLADAGGWHVAQFGAEELADLYRLATPDVIRNLVHVAIAAQRLTDQARAFHDDTGHDQSEQTGVACDRICDAMHLAEDALATLGRLLEVPA